MEVKRIAQRGGAALALVALGACSSGGEAELAAGATGTLSVALTDAPVDSVEEIWLEFDGVTLRRAGGPPIDIPFDPPVTVDLLTLTNGNSVQLLDGEELPAGTYEQLALHVNAQHDGVRDSYVVTDVGEEYEIFVPSGAQTGLKLIGGFTITADQHTSFLIDWDARMGLVNPPGLPGYILRPTLRIIDMTEYGILTGTVAASLLNGDCVNDVNTDSGNAVYVYDRLDTEDEGPGDIGGEGPQPVATAAVTFWHDAGAYAYEVMLSPGDYTVAFTCQAGADHPEEANDIAFVGVDDVEVKDGETSIVYFGE